jgi:hypothetical protein
LAVKDKQPTLHQDIREYFEGLETGKIQDLPEDVRISEEEPGHGRTERREMRTVTDLEWLGGEEGLERVSEYHPVPVLADREWGTACDKSVLYQQRGYGCPSMLPVPPGSLVDRESVALAS